MTAREKTAANRNAKAYLPALALLVIALLTPTGCKERQLYDDPPPQNEEPM